MIWLRRLAAVSSADFILEKVEVRVKFGRLGVASCCEKPTSQLLGGTFYSVCRVDRDSKE